jgi:hypothetical protein
MWQQAAYGLVRDPEIASPGVFETIHRSRAGEKLLNVIEQARDIDLHRADDRTDRHRFEHGREGARQQL